MGVSEIADDAPLFGDSGLGLDSVDALELVLEIERHFDVSIEDNEEGRKVLASVATLAAYIQERQAA
ncbi:MAG: acyl carrier protein [Proteobacteria bacterium]|nr:acyl carrier protein [Pseudomonadota bacterium]